jgi:phenylalanyl-tRNA synthetase beta chain
MKISLNWLKTFLPIDKTPEELKDLLTDIGLEAESAEAYESHPGGLMGLVVAEVKTCVPHPDADKLKVTTVDCGDGELHQVVCGAPNVAAGQKVVLAKVGTTLYPKGSEAFSIKKAKIRGVESNGMLCAEDEIGVGESHAGIIVLADEIPVGTAVAELYDVVSDVVFEIGLTPNRTDAFSHYGVARDLAAALNFREKKAEKVQALKAEAFQEGTGHPVKVEISQPDGCFRYAGLVIEGLQVAPSPSWLQERLKAIGQKPINNVVDATNYILHSYGQPLHAFDLSEIEGGTIRVGMQPEGTAFKALDGEELKLHAEDLMINNAAEGMCIAGVYGGAKSGVKASTTAIFLESARFNPKYIRRTSLRHSLRTDAAQHFEKGIDPEITVEVLKIAAKLITELAGGKVTSAITDIVTAETPPHRVQLNTEKVRKHTGAPITNEEIRQILDSLEIKVLEVTDVLQLEVPAYRTDVTRDVDVIEDILRIYGYNNVRIPSRFTAAVNITRGLDAEKLYRMAANMLCANGFYEMLNNSLVRSRHLEGFVSPELQVRLLSSINVELDTLRPCMQVSALEVLQHNINRSQKNLKLFEYGQTYIKTEEGYSESRHLFLAVTGEKLHNNWTTKGGKSDFFYLKGLVGNLLQRLGVKVSGSDDAAQDMYSEALALKSGQKTVAIIGKMSSGLLKQWDIKQEVYVADIQWDNVVKVASKGSSPKISLARFPSVRRDLALLLDKNVKFTDVKEIALKYGKKQLREVDLFDVYEGDKIAEDKKSYAVSFVFRDDEKTLADKEVDAVMGKLMEQYQKQLNAIVRGQA